MLRRILFALAGLLAVALAFRIYNRAFRGNVWQAYLVSVRSDLRNLADAEAAYRARTGRFAPDLAALGDSAFRPSEGVTIEVLESTDSTLHASGTHQFFRPEARCVLTLSPSVASPAPRCDGFFDWFYRHHAAPANTALT